MFKELLLKKLLQSKLGHLPKEEQEQIITIVAKNPELFQEIALKIKLKTDSGMEQMAATMSVMAEYKDRLGGLVKGAVS